MLERLFGHTDQADIDAYADAPSDHDQSECGGTWRSHADPQERLACIKTSDERR